MKISTRQIILKRKRKTLIDEFVKKKKMEKLSN